MSADVSGTASGKGSPFGWVPFQAHVQLLRLFLTHRAEIVESIEVLLNAQRKPVQYRQDRAILTRLFEDCFFTRPEAAACEARSQTRLRGQLEAAHGAAGFTPRQVQHAFNDLIHPAEMMIRAFYCWQQTRWPGRQGRVHYAQTLFNLYLLRCLQFLSLRRWDASSDAARQGDRSGSAGVGLAELQSVLDELWRGSPAGQPAIVRDARWLIPLAQSLITDELAPYFEIARQVAEELPEADALEIQKAHVRMLGGHLTSQIRYYCTKDKLPLEDRSVVLRTRTSNALDFALLVQGLVTVLAAYDRIVQTGDERLRLEMAGAIFQGISADPELFLNRIDLLRAYSMIEHVFIVAEASEGHSVYSQMGQRHVQALSRYGALINRLSMPLREDFRHFKPSEGGCSPYGVIFGLPTHLIEHMALKALQHDAETRFSLEDIFEDVFGDESTSAAKLAWVNGWRKLPHIPSDVQRLYDYPQQFAEDIYHRIGRELAGYGSAGRTGRLHLASGGRAESSGSAIPELAPRYWVSSDPQVLSAHRAERCDRAQLLRDRQEAHYVVSYETPGGWNAIKKELLTEVLGVGRDARITGLPFEAAEVLQLMCAGFVVLET